MTGTRAGQRGRGSVAVAKRGRARAKAPGGSEDKLKLERVLGHTCYHNAAFAWSAETGDLVYPAGAVAVVYNARKNKQTAFLSRRGARDSGKALVSVAISANGELVAAGESGHAPAILVWEVKTGNLVAELKGHRYGVASLAFSPARPLLASVGFQHDSYVYMWDWRSSKVVACNKVSTRVHAACFNAAGSALVTVGPQVRFWHLDEDGSVPRSNRRSAAAASAAVAGASVLDGRAGVLGSHRDARFVSVAPDLTPSSLAVLAVTANGLLCSFAPNRLLERWVHLKVASAFAVDTAPGRVACACSGGVVRLFASADLAYQATLPRPPALPAAPPGSRADAAGADDAPVYPDAVAVRFQEPGYTRLAVVYSDRTIVIWDISQLDKIGVYRALPAHASTIWDVAVCPRTQIHQPQYFPANTFVTASADGTLRIWNLDSPHHTLVDQSGPRRTILGSASTSGLAAALSKECIHMLHVDPAAAHATMRVDNPLAGVPETMSAAPGGVRCLRIDAAGRFLASGDRHGNLRVHDLTSMDMVSFVEAHDAEILSLDFSREIHPILDDDSNDDGSDAAGQDQAPFYLASASRDRLIHLYDVRRNFAVAGSLDNHSGSITAVRFASDNRLLSCSADKSIVFRRVAAAADADADVSPYHQVQLPHGTLYDMDVDVTQKYVVTCGQERRVQIFNVATGKQVRTYPLPVGFDGGKPGKTDAIKVVLDPAGIFAAVSTTDKSIRLLDFYSGGYLTRVAGHSEQVTSLCFTLDCQRLISVSGDGTIFVWRLAPALTRAMIDRLSELDPARARDLESRAARPKIAFPPAVPSQPVAAAGAVLPSAATAAASAAVPTQAHPDVDDGTGGDAGDGDAVPSAAVSPKTPSPDDNIQLVGRASVCSVASAGAANLFGDDADAHLPAWAQKTPGVKQRRASDSPEDPDAAGASPGSVEDEFALQGRWAQRVAKGGLRLFSDLDGAGALAAVPGSADDLRRFTVEPSNAKAAAASAMHVQDLDETGGSTVSNIGDSIVDDGDAVGAADKDDDDADADQAVAEVEQAVAEEPDAFAVTAQDVDVDACADPDADNDDAGPGEQGGASETVPPGDEEEQTDAVCATLSSLAEPFSAGVAAEQSSRLSISSRVVPKRESARLKAKQQQHQHQHQQHAGADAVSKADDEEADTSTRSDGSTPRSPAAAEALASARRASMRLRARKTELASEVERTRERLRSMGVVFKPRTRPELVQDPGISITITEATPTAAQTDDEQPLAEASAADGVAATPSAADGGAADARNAEPNSYDDGFGAGATSDAVEAHAVGAEAKTNENDALTVTKDGESDTVTVAEQEEEATVTATKDDGNTTVTAVPEEISDDVDSDMDGDAASGGETAGDVEGEDAEVEGDDDDDDNDSDDVEPELQEGEPRKLSSYQAAIEQLHSTFDQTLEMYSQCQDEDDGPVVEDLFHSLFAYMHRKIAATPAGTRVIHEAGHTGSGATAASSSGLSEQALTGTAGVPDLLNKYSDILVRMVEQRLTLAPSAAPRDAKDANDSQADNPKAADAPLTRSRAASRLAGS